MMMGTVDANGIPTVSLTIAGKEWFAIIDTGFNGDLELPESLYNKLQARYVGKVTSTLAGGYMIEEDVYLVEFLFDGQTIQAESTFASNTQILIGTNLLKEYHLEINFVNRTVKLIKESSKQKRF